MKKIFGKIKAYFNVKGKSMEMDLSAAEIKDGKAFLHPVDDDNHVYMIKTKDVSIFINPEDEISEEDITVADYPKEKPATGEPDKKKGTLYDSEKEPTAFDLPAFKNKKVVRFSLYNDEYETLMKYIDENGYKKAEFFLACANAAKKNSMTSLYNKYLQDHKQRRKEERLAAKTGK